MKDHTGDYRGFYRCDPPFISSGVAEVFFGFYSPDGGTSGEMAMRWYDLNRERVPRLEAFNDAWHALAQMPDLIAALAEIDNEPTTPDQFCTLLLLLGFIQHGDHYPVP